MNRYFVVIAILCSLHSSFLFADEQEPFVLLHLPLQHAPYEAQVYVTEESTGGLQNIRGTFLEENDAGGLLWGAFLSAKIMQPKRVVMLVKEEGGKKHFFDFHEGEFQLFSSQSPDDVRTRIALVREQIAQAEDDTEKLQSELSRLQKDVHLIGGFEAVEQVEGERSYEEREVQRVLSQIAQLQRSIEAVKQWKNPSDLPERKRIYLRDTQAMREQLRDKSHE